MQLAVHVLTCLVLNLRLDLHTRWRPAEQQPCWRAVHVALRSWQTASRTLCTGAYLLVMPVVLCAARTPFSNVRCVCVSAGAHA
jgi:hypothetical protein